MAGRSTPGRRTSLAGCPGLSHSYNTRRNVNPRRRSKSRSRDLRSSSKTRDSAKFSSDSDSGSVSPTRNCRAINQAITRAMSSDSFENQDYCNEVRQKTDRNTNGWINNRVKIGLSLLVGLLAVGWAWREYKMMTTEILELKETVKNLSDSEINNHRLLGEKIESFKTQTLQIIQKEIENLNADKTGRTDFALESAGASIVQLSHGTENYGQPKSSLLGIAICEGIHGPRSIIQKGSSPGECWALKGTTGGVVIRLLSAVKIDAVTMEHISKNISPNGDTTTAPKDFSVWGLKTQTDRGQMLGQFQYDIDGPLVQTFPVLTSVSTLSFEFVELKIVSNHGNPDFTCVYRFRVHGTMERK